jgi:PIN domain nuclease of toxin-antitoxin system
VNLLLDTHVLLWIAAGEAVPGPRARDAIADGRRLVFVSAASAWEIAIKARLGKLDVPDDLPEMLEHYRFTPLDVTTRHAMAVRELPDLHRDPFDRMLVAQARAEGLTVVSHDPQVLAYDVASLPATR